MYDRLHGCRRWRRERGHRDDELTSIYPLGINPSGRGQGKQARNNPSRLPITDQNRHETDTQEGVDTILETKIETTGKTKHVREEHRSRK